MITKTFSGFYPLSYKYEIYFLHVNIVIYVFVLSMSLFVYLPKYNKTVYFDQLRLIMTIQKMSLWARGKVMFDSKKYEWILIENRLISQFSRKIVKMVSFVFSNEWKETWSCACRIIRKTETTKDDFCVVNKM